MTENKLTPEEFCKRAAKEHGWFWPYPPGTHFVNEAHLSRQELEATYPVLHVSYDMTPKLIYNLYEVRGHYA